MTQVSRWKLPLTSALIYERGTYFTQEDQLVISHVEYDSACENTCTFSSVALEEFSKVRENNPDDVIRVYGSK